MTKRGGPPKPRNATPPAPVRRCRWIPLTKGKFALVDARDFEKLTRYSWTYHWQGYAFRSAPKSAGTTHFRMHREILGVTDPKIQVDRENGDGLDNRRRNLRPATNAQNTRNNFGSRFRAGPYKGVGATGRKNQPWAARITVNMRTVNLGRFKTAEEAAAAYDAAAVKYFGVFAKTNREIQAAGRPRQMRAIVEKRLRRQRLK